MGGGGRGGGAPKSSVGARKGALIWLVTREGGQGGDGGGQQRAVWEQQRVHSPLFWTPKNLTTGLIWLVTREGWGETEVAQGGRARGDGGGGTREKGCSGSACWVPSKPNNWSDLAGDEGGGWGETWGEVERGSSLGATKGDNWFDLAGTRGGGVGGGGGGPGRWGRGHVGAIKGGLVPPFGLP